MDRESKLEASGLSVSLVVFWALYARMKRKQVAEGPPDEIDTLTTRAEKRLATSSLSETSKLTKLPLALVLGPTGGCKTTVITRSGLEPELLKLAQLIAELDGQDAASARKAAPATKAVRKKKPTARTARKKAAKKPRRRPSS